MPNRNIYFTDELAKQMKSFPKENWSSVCQEAVADRVQLLLRNSEATTRAVERAKARLASERAEYVADAYDRGERDGIAWAADHASFETLRRYHTAMEDGPPAIDFPVPDGESVTQTVAKIGCGVDPESIYDEKLSTDEFQFLVDLCNAVGLRMDGDDFTSSDYWHGFINGVLAIYKQL